MARMIPDRSMSGVDGHPTSAAETQVYAALRDTLTDDYTVVGWVAWQGVNADGQQVQGEADFVVIHPERGFLVIEVKGGCIERDAATHTWRSTDRRGVTHEIKDPFEQVARNLRALGKRFAELLGLPRLPMMTARAVIFPDADGDPAVFGAEADPRFTFLADDLPRLGERIHAFVSGWRLTTGTQGVVPDWARRLEDMIAPSFRLPVRLGRLIRDGSEEADRLTQEQFSILDHLARNRRVLVTGAAGTGKTMLALEKARRLARLGARTLLTCFNRPLAEYLATMAGDEPGLVVLNYHQLCYQWARRVGFDGPDPDSPDVRDPARERALGRTYFDTTLRRAFLEALSAIDERFDAIVVDEAQDFSAAMQGALLKAMRKPRAGYLFVFQDEGQGIFAGRRGWAPRGMPEYHLSTNLRNSRQIHGVLRALNADDDTTAAGREGVAPEYVLADTPALAAAEIERRIRTLTTTDGVRLAHIAVLTVGRPQIAALAPNGRLAGFEVTQDPADPSPRLYLDRITRFKGLERDVVFLTGLGNPPAHTRAEPLLYVGASRARSHLIVVDEQAVLGRFVARPGAGA